jgi:plasmid stabilization system protein ParE
MIVNTLPEARAALDEAFKFYEARQVGLGQRFLDAVLAAAARIEMFPFNPAEGPRGIRRSCTRKCPDALAYVVRRDAAYIVAAVHSSRRPEYWIDRLDQLDENTGLDE